MVQNIYDSEPRLIVLGLSNRVIHSPRQAFWLDNINNNTYCLFTLTL